MALTIGETVVVRGTLAVVVSDQTIAGQEFVGIVPLQAVQYLPANQVNLPPPPVQAPGRVIGGPAVIPHMPTPPGTGMLAGPTPTRAAK